MSLFDLQARLTLDSANFVKGISEAKNSAQDFADKTGTSSESIGTKMQNVGGKISKLGSTLTKTMTIPIVGAFTAGTKKAIDFQDGLAKVYTIADKNKVPIDQMKKSLLDLSNQSGRSTTELSEGLYQALSASVDTKDSIGFLTTAVNLSKAGFLETAGSVDVLTTIMNAYGMSADKANSIADQLVQTQNDGKTTVNELAASMGTVIPTAAAMNVPLEQLNASYALMTKQGINTANATTQLSGMFTELSNEGSDVAGILKEKTGKSFGELMASGMTLGDILKILSDHVGGNGEKFANLWGNVRAGRGALALVNAGVDEFNQETEKMQKSSGNVSKALETLNTPGAKLRKSMNRLTNALAELGDRLVPFVEKFAEGLIKLMDKWDKLDDGTKDMIVKIGLILAVAGPILGLVGSLISGLGSLALVAGALGVGLAPMIALIVGIVAAIGAIIAVITNWGAISEWFAGIWESVKEKIAGVWQSITETVTGALDSIKQFFAGAWQNITDAVSTAFETIKNAVTVGLMAVGEVIKAAFKIITLPWRFIWENVKGIVMPIVNSIAKFLSDTFKKIAQTISSVIGSVQKFLSDAWNKIKSTAQSIWNAVYSAVIKPVFDKIRSVITTVVNGIKEFIHNAFNTIKERIVTPIQNARDKAKEIFDNIKSAIAEKAQAVIENVKEKFKKVVSLITAPFKSAKKAVEKIIDKLKDAFDFNWSLPHLKLPHISISGSFSIDPPSVPHFDIDWYKKATYNPILFGRNSIIPTMSGFKGFSDGVGQEMLYSRHNLLRDIREASGGATEALLALLESYLPQIVDGMGNDIVLDDGTLVGRITPQVDAQLGVLSKKKGRGL